MPEKQQPNLTERDKTRFLERGFTVVENTGHSLRLIKRSDARHAVSVKWDDLPALRELITLALDDGPMVVGLDVSGQMATAARSTLASKVLEAVEAEEESRFGKGAHGISAALRDLFQKEGIEIPDR
jgi:hypothetical protein